MVRRGCVATPLDQVMQLQHQLLEGLDKTMRECLLLQPRLLLSMLLCMLHWLLLLLEQPCQLPLRA
jgi:hypothetical protein